MRLLHVLCAGVVLFVSSASFGQQNDPITASRFGISIDGVQTSVFGFEGGDVPGDVAKPTSTPLKLTVDRTGSEAIWQWIAASINSGPTEKKIEGQAKGRRRAVFTGAHITEVKFDDLDANAGKKPMRVVVTIVPKQVVAVADDKSKPEPALKGWHTANFRVKIGGLPVERVSKIDSLTWKQKVVEGGKQVLELADVRMTVDGSGAKALEDALAKDKSKALTITLTGDDGSVWKTITVTGLKIHASQAAGANKSMILKGSKILVN